MGAYNITVYRGKRRGIMKKIDLKERAQKLKTDIPAVFLAMKHKNTPVLAKIIAGIAVVYALSPIDLIPDFIPVLGYLDDILLLPALIALAVKLIPKEVFKECQTHAKELWNDGVPSKKWYAIPIVLLWVLVIVLIVKAVTG